MLLEGSHFKTMQMPKLFKHGSFNTWDEPVPVGALE